MSVWRAVEEGNGPTPAASVVETVFFDMNSPVYFFHASLLLNKFYMLTGYDKEGRAKGPGGASHMWFQTGGGKQAKRFWIEMDVATWINYSVVTDYKTNAVMFGL